MTKAEQETIIRWDEEDQIAHLYTAHPPQARRWEKRGYPVQVLDRDAAGVSTAAPDSATTMSPSSSARAAWARCIERETPRSTGTGR